VERVLLAALLKVELPGYTACLVDGGTVAWGGDTYTSRDPVLGVPDAFEQLSEGVGDQAPAASITFILPNDANPATANSQQLCDSRVRLWIAELDTDAGTVIGTPTQVADWLVDYPEIATENGVRRVTFALVSHGERLFELNLGNTLTSRFHQRIYPGELGLDNAAGVATSVAWGAASAPRGTTTTAPLNPSTPGTAPTRNGQQSR
jgi:hypothetical protein